MVIAIVAVYVSVISVLFNLWILIKTDKSQKDCGLFKETKDRLWDSLDESQKNEIKKMRREK